jgi:oligogalacturonide lyase
MAAGVWTRRAFITSTPLLIAGQEQLFKYKDPATEFDITRLTDPKFTSLLPPGSLRPVNGRSSSLLFCSDSSGTLQPYRIDLKNGEILESGQATALVPDSLSFLPGDRSICYFDGKQLVSTVAGRHAGGRRRLYECPMPWEKAPGFGLSIDGNFAAFPEKNGGAYRLQLVSLLRGGATTVLEADTAISDVMPRPRRAGLLYRKEGGLWLVNFDGQQNRPLKTAPGTVGPFVWSGDGRTILYLRFPEERGKLNEIRELTPDANEDKLVAQTSQFATFARNTDGMVFAGASANKASAHILLLLRTSRRELTLCEHRASDPSKAEVIFTPASQRILFQSDRDGKPAIYTIRVEKFVEETES